MYVNLFQGKGIDTKGSTNALSTEIEQAMNLIGESLKALPSGVRMLVTLITSLCVLHQVLCVFVEWTFTEPW